MNRLVFPAFVALAVLAASQGLARANGNFGFGFGFGIGLSFSGSAWSSGGCNSCCTPCCKPAGPTCCGGIPAGGYPGCGLAVGAPAWNPPAAYNGYGYDPQKAALAWQAQAYNSQLAYGYYPAYGYYQAPANVPQAPAYVPQAPAWSGAAAVANAR